MHTRVCRNCGEEYRPEVVQCADCGGQLDDRFDEPGAAPPIEVPAQARLPIDGNLRVVFSASRAADLEPLAERLGEARVPFAVRGGVNAFDLMVPHGDVERALELVRAMLGHLPDPQPGFVDEGRCPACGAALTSRSGECPDCGLALSGPEAGE